MNLFEQASISIAAVDYRYALRARLRAEDEYERHTRSSRIRDRAREVLVKAKAEEEICRLLLADEVCEMAELARSVGSVDEEAQS